MSPPCTPSRRSFAVRAVLCAGAIALYVLSGTYAWGQRDADSTPGAGVGVTGTDAGAEQVAVDVSAHAATPVEEEQSVAIALGTEAGDVPDPIADEGARVGSAEGEAVPERAVVAVHIGALSDRACLRALLRAQVPFERLREPAPGIATGVRITGPIEGVRYRASDRRDVHELMDCRLAVALVHFSRMLRYLHIVEVRHFSTYRPPGARDIADRAIQRRHAAGLAIDAAWFIRDDGQRFSVERDFHGRIGQATCGPDVRVPHHDGARLLRTVACDAARIGIFNVILTPDYNPQHENHFHLEVARNVTWRFVH